MQSEIRKGLTIAFTLFCLLLFGNCKPNNMKEKFAWGAAISAPKLYPIEVIRGRIGNNDYSIFFGTIYGINNPGWGEGGGSMDDRSLQYLPDTLEFTWHSLAEDVYYTGKWHVDTEYIHQVFKEKYINLEGLEDKMKQFNIGLGPKGKVVLWADGSGHTIEVGSFQAHDTIITAKDLRPDDTHMFEAGRTAEILADTFYIKREDQERIKKEGYPDPTLFTQYQKRYDWEAKVLWPDTLSDVRIFYFNGEFETIMKGELESKFFVGRRAIPERLSIGYLDKDKKRGLEVRFKSFDELYEVFDTLSKEDSKITLFVDLDFSTHTSGKVYLMTKNKRIQLHQVRLSNSWRLVNE